MTSEPSHLSQEGDLLYRLLSLGSEEKLDSFLRDALTLVAEKTGADKGYIELRGQGALESELWNAAFGLSASELGTVKSGISNGIIAKTLATGETIFTPAAFLDPQFNDRDSVRLGNIGSVLCTSIGQSACLGLIYLQTNAGGRSFSAEDKRRIELLASLLAPFGERLLVRRELEDAADPTSELRKRLRADALVGRSPAMAKVLNEIVTFAGSKLPILLTGPTGTGKSLVARVIHNNSKRDTGPFVALNCANFSGDLFESEVFGHERGAFTSADQKHVGKIKAAEGGTLFLDEIGHLSRACQNKLLTFLDTGHYFPLGSNRQEKADVRIIAATNKAMDEAMRKDEVGVDFYYRLSTVTINMPSLAERPMDLPALSAHLLERICENGELPALSMANDALNAIRAQDWPGNIRDLHNVLARGAARAAAEHAEEVRRIHLFPSHAEDHAEPLSWDGATREFQGRLLRETLEAEDWNIPRVAARLDLSRNYVYDLMKQHAIDTRLGSAKAGKDRANP